MINTSERMLIAHSLPFGLGGSAFYNTVIDILDLTYFLALILKAACLQNVFRSVFLSQCSPRDF